MYTQRSDEAALQNPVILREIFKYRPLRTKEIRLMSQAWNQTLLSFPKPLIGLVLDSDRNLGKSEFAKMEGKLARRIRDVGRDESELSSLPLMYGVSRICAISGYHGKS
ncbi:hypothetical protein Fcan01_16868 [Folsomia candida]|uniref:Uncharacterized protein n=1 Tax=Folsomia candida TaxID=158441 RepID=A0A226DTB0_FOLCA|nr:hypothetical protein Fcan01_16868 [Folsomia candida]